jgi:hypothetical protein
MSARTSRLRVAEQKKRHNQVRFPVRKELDYAFDLQLLKLPAKADHRGFIDLTLFFILYTGSAPGFVVLLFFDLFNPNPFRFHRSPISQNPRSANFHHFL